MKKLIHPLSITLMVVTGIFILSFLLPKKEVPTYSDDMLRQMALARDMKPIPSESEKLLNVTNNPDNPLSRQKIALGKALFFDTRLSKDETISCASCHKLKEGGDDNLPTAIGFHGRANPSHLNSPTVLNAALSRSQFWDGRAKDVEEQAGSPVQAPFEMNMTPKEVEERLNKDKQLQKRFEEVFGSKKITLENVRKAIGAYERTLLTRGAYERFLEGDNNLKDFPDACIGWSQAQRAEKL